MKKGIYILPSLFTLGNLTMGFFSIIFSIQANFDRAAWYILFAGVFDILDGKIARLTNTTSTFGAELDSLSDLVSFGLAPAILIHQFVLFEYSKWGVVICLLYVIAAALRLARFNTLKDDDETQYFFKGLPTPAAAGVITTFVLINLTTKNIPIISNYFHLLINLWPLILILVSYAMVSNIHYVAFKKFKFSKPKTLRFFSLIFIGGLLIWRFPENMLFIIFLMYFLSGAIDLLKKLNRAAIILKEKKIKDKKI